MIWRKSRWLCTLHAMTDPMGRWTAALLFLAACSRTASAPRPPAPSPTATKVAAIRGGPAPADTVPPGLPPVTRVEGPLRLTVIYPGPKDLIDARDSTFIFGSTGSGGATLTVNGQPVAVAGSGGWIAWIPIPPDSLITLTLVARQGADSIVLPYQIRRIFRFIPPVAPVWIDSNSVTPGSRAWWPADEYLPVSVRAAEGARVQIRLPDGRLIPLTPDLAPAEVPWGIRAFDRDSSNLAVRLRADRYAGAVRGLRLGDDPGSLLGPPPPVITRQGGGCCAGPARQGTEPLIEAIIGSDTARMRLPLRLAPLDTVPMVVEFNDDTAHKGNTDSVTIGRTRPGATYHWFFPTGTRAVVTGRLGDDLRVRLSRAQEAWVPAIDAIALPAGTPVTRATVSSLTLSPREDRLVLRVPMTQRIPFRVEEESDRLTLRLYNTVGDINWTRYGTTDPYLRDIRWLQVASDEVTLVVDLSSPVWGYRARWSGNDLLLEIRRPPVIDPVRPLAGRLVVVDPGHPPLGATGPTGLRESEANLAVALELRALLEADGARVIMTRTADVSVDLAARTRLADSLDAEVLISIHNNALPDGLNPFTNNGSSVFYNQPRSLPLAQAIQTALVRRLGLRDLGAGRGDLALVRPTWMPSVLCEGLFMMLPEQEAALREPEGQRRYALAVRDGLRAWLQRVATTQGAGVP